MEVGSERSIVQNNESASADISSKECPTLLKCCATGEFALFLIMSRRCSTKRSPSRLLVSPMYTLAHERHWMAYTMFFEVQRGCLKLLEGGIRFVQCGDGLVRVVETIVEFDTSVETFQIIVECKFVYFSDARSDSDENDNVTPPPFPPPPPPPPPPLPQENQI
ncbi:hypothetical protein CAPTEDRAFT_198465 [Capitella teleta]|uniref:Uncharacterized protein n=1 Tax=Capitella teleta TaxID=283909 RepID=R7TTA0_CAPTE|nr:hypothetical protein CAPTEDRAFT_198465 [Capitella teleta]|eukprot:ELT94716.1 hypothetical protein CAPTEDRAFT_198465 [Capitella teleta]